MGELCKWAPTKVNLGVFEIEGNECALKFEGLAKMGKNLPFVVVGKKMFCCCVVGPCLEIELALPLAPKICPNKKPPKIALFGGNLKMEMKLAFGEMCVKQPGGNPN